MGRRTFVAVSLAGILAQSCAPSLFEREAMMAKQAELRDDAAAALEHWAIACRADPTHKDACQSEQSWAAKLRTRSVSSATIPCNAGDLEHCVAVLRDLVRLRPGDVRALELMRLAALAKRAECGNKEVPGKLDSVMERVACIQGTSAAFKEAGQKEIVLEEQRHAAAQLVSASSVAPAASYVLLRTAQCLSPAVEAGRAKVAAAAFLAQAALPVLVAADSNGGREIPKAALGTLCGAMAREVGEGVRCAATAEDVARDLSLKVSLNLGRVTHAKSPEAAVAKYVSGTERVTNPERGPAERALDRAKRSFDAIEFEARDRQLRCQQSKMRDACDGYNAIQSTYNARQDEYIRAKKHLAETPAYFDRDVVESVPYTVWHHRFSVPYTIVTTTGTGESANASGVFVRESKEQPGIAAAGVRAIPLISPTDEEFDAEIVAQASRAGAPILRRAIATRASCADRSWSLDGPDLGCRSTSQLYLTGRMPELKAIFPRLSCELNR